MALEENFVDAIFYVPKSDPPIDSPPSLRDLLEKAFPAITPRRPDVTSNEFVPVTWAGLNCLAYCQEDSYHYRLYLELGRADMYEPLRGVWDDPLPLEEDPLLPMAIAFREVCELLGVKVAMIATTDEQSSDEYLEDTYPYILSCSGFSLICLRYALLYVSKEFDLPSDMKDLAEERDVIVCSQGYLIFGGNKSSLKRWI
jgi:hypothetical protein